MRLLFLALVLLSSLDYARADSCVQLGTSDWDELMKLVHTDDSNIDQWKKLEALVAQSKRACAAALADSKVAGCLDNLDHFVTNQRLTREPGHSLQFRLSDAEYLASQPQEMISFPDEFKDGLPKNWKEICEKNSWPYVQFVSKSLPNPPMLSFGRLLIVVPGEKFDRWMQYTIPTRGTTERLVDFMGVEKVAPGKAKLHFVEYWRNIWGKKPVYRKNLASCYKCHPSGMKQIVPAYGSTDEKGWQTVKEFNDRINNYGDFDWGEGTVVPAYYGPPMGDKVGCTNCHDGSFRGVINAAHLGERSRHQIYFKLVQDLAMPPGKAKNPEYKALFETMRKAELLSEKDRHALYFPFILTPAVKLLDLKLGGDKGPMAVSNEYLLRFLKHKKVITSAEYDTAKAILKKAEKEMDATYRQLKDDYRGDLLAWLKGERAECGELFGNAGDRNPAGKPPLKPSGGKRP